MELDDELCLCFHVSQRKVLNYIRIHGLKRASQLSECSGAGTGCGWCVPYLKRCFESAQAGSTLNDVSAAEYALGRGSYIKDGKGKPPSKKTSGE